VAGHRLGALSTRAAAREDGGRAAALRRAGRNSNQSKARVPPGRVHADDAAGEAARDVGGEVAAVEFGEDLEGAAVGLVLQAKGVGAADAETLVGIGARRRGYVCATARTGPDCGHG
jgi:hypothetical protein